MEKKSTFTPEKKRETMESIIKFIAEEFKEDIKNFKTINCTGLLMRSVLYDTIKIVNERFTDKNTGLIVREEISVTKELINKKQGDGKMSNLIKVLNQDGQLVVTSRQIAADFEKEHKDVLEKVRNLVAENSAVKNMFIESSYENRGKQYPEYLLTRDGFSLLVMGFTGAKALEWKLKYIEAFNKMEEELKNPYKGLSKELQSIFAIDKKTQEIENRVDNLESNMPLFNVECKELQALVKKIGTRVLGGYKSLAYNDNSLRGRVYSDIQHQLRREFGVERYEAIKRGQLGTAQRIVSEYKVPTVLADEIQLINNQIELSMDEVATVKEEF